MPKFIRKIINQVSNQVRGRLSPLRRDLQFPIRVSFAPEKNSGILSVKPESLSILGETKDLSTNGIAFLVDSIRLREYYLVGEDRILDVVIELPEAKVRMKVVGKRYEQVGEHLSVHKYVIGAAIDSMNEIDREIYESYLKPGKRIRKKKNSSTVFEFEASKS